MKKKAVLPTTENLRLRSFKHLCIILLLVTVYLSICISGLFLRRVSLATLETELIWCLTHPVQCGNDKTAGCIMAGIVIWLAVSCSAYARLSYHLIHGREYGSAKFGNIAAFNKKYAAASESENKVLSENIRFRYQSDTLRNNNMFVIGGSGAGKTSFLLTPNMLNLHGSNVFTDPKGTLIEQFGNFLSAQEDTRVYSINLCEMEKSMHFNPFPFIRKRLDVTKLVRNLILNTAESETIKTAAADPFWEKAERMFLECLFLYTWLECPISTTSLQTGEVIVLERNFRTIMYLLDEAQFDEKGNCLLDVRMKRLAAIEQTHPAVKAYRRYRSGPEDTIRSVISTVNARMQPFDDEELLDLLSENDIPFDEFGTGINGNGTTKSNLFIIIPDEDITYNFIPGMIYTLFFQELYYQARIFHGKLPIDVGFWLDEFANIKMPANFDKILAGCRSRGIYCVPFVQSLAQMNTLFADGAWEGVVGNCDTFLYLGGNEESTFEYISKLLGKWTVDKRTSGESRGASGSYSENYDVIGRELMMEYEVRLLPDDECILFVRGEEPLRDKKWFPWEHSEYETAISYGIYQVHRPEQDEERSCCFLDEKEMAYQKALAKKDQKIKIVEMDPIEFMMMPLERLAEQEKTSPGISQKELLKRLQQAYRQEKEKADREKRQIFLKQYDKLPLVDIYTSEQVSDNRKRIIKELLQKHVPEDDIKCIIHPELSDNQVLEKKKAYVQMYSFAST